MRINSDLLAEVYSTGRVVVTDMLLLVLGLAKPNY